MSESIAPYKTGKIRAASIHLAVSATIGTLAGMLVFMLWYPFPYHTLLGVSHLFALLLIVDVVMGPLLTAVVYSPNKSSTELSRDIGIIAVLQLAALLYGLHTLAIARPIQLAFEADQFRVVRQIDVADPAFDALPSSLRPALWRGPGLIGVRITRPGDPDYLRSLELSLSGLTAAFRPSHWVPYDVQRPAVRARARAVSTLRAKHPEHAALIAEALVDTGLPENRLGYLPMRAERGGDWVVLLRLDDAEPVGYLPLDGW
ncbi:MAG: TfpX/TfpZ family type IV pilin accessory protein [Pseudomonadota bacterium]